MPLSTCIMDDSAFLLDNYDYSDGFNGTFPAPIEASQTFRLGSAAVRCVLCWLIWVATMALAVKHRHNRTRGWLLFRLIVAVLSVFAVAYSLELAAEASIRASGTQAHHSVVLYYVQKGGMVVATSAFVALLLTVATGYCITRTDLGQHKTAVMFIPVIYLVTGLVAESIDYVLDVNKQIYLDLPAWKQFVWLMCTLVHLSAPAVAWVFTFDILQQEIDAIDEQEKANKAGTQDPTADPDQPAHAAPPPMDPTLAEEGVTYYKNLLGPNQNISHIAGADIEAQEFQTVADRLNFEVKKRLMGRLHYGVGFYLGATMGVILLPLFINAYVQSAMVILQYIAQMGFLAALVWTFLPVEDSPYLMIGDSGEDGDGLGGMDLDTELAMQEGPEELSPAGLRAGGSATWGSAHGGAGGAVELQQTKRPGSGNVAASVGTSGGDAATRDQNGVGPVLPVSRPAGQPAAAPLSVRTAPVAPAHEARFSLGGDEEDELHEIRLNNASPGAAVGAERPAGANGSS